MICPDVGTAGKILCDRMSINTLSVEEGNEIGAILHREQSLHR